MTSHRALVAAKVPSCLEPVGLYRTDGKRPDGITVAPWKNGKLLVWDTTCPDTFASSYSSSATREAGAVAALAEERKTAKDAHLNPTHAFSPVAIETSGVFGPQTMAFLKELSQRLAQASGDLPPTSFKGCLWQSSKGTLFQFWQPLANCLAQISSTTEAVQGTAGAFENVRCMCMCNYIIIKI